MVVVPSFHALAANGRRRRQRAWREPCEFETSDASPGGDAVYGRRIAVTPACGATKVLRSNAASAGAAR
jgi:hypothetical protein